MEASSCRTNGSAVGNPLPSPLPAIRNAGYGRFTRASADEGILHLTQKNLWDVHCAPTCRFAKSSGTTTPADIVRVW